MMHTYLQDPENARAYAHLIEFPIGSVRKWAKALGWSDGKMQRFLGALRRYRLGSIETCQHHSVFRPLNGKKEAFPHPTPVSPPPLAPPHEVHRSASVRIDAHRCVSAPLGSSGLVDQQPSAAGLEYSTALIKAMNDALVARFADGYRAVLPDNRSSIDTATRLELAGVPPDRAEAHLLEQCRLFNPSKHGKGELPRSLAYFERGILKAWRGEAQLKLFPKMDMQVDRVPRVPEYKTEEIDRPRAGEETIAAGVEEFRALANSPHKPQRMK